VGGQLFDSAEFFDSSSTLARVGIFSRLSPAQPHIDFWPVGVEEGMVVVGGGVRASDNPGKLITASYPKADLSAWFVSAKDHLIPDASPVVGFAIGLKLFRPDRTAIARDVLLKHLHLTSVTSGVVVGVNQPEAFAPTWSGCALLGGGLQVNSAEPGSLATASDLGPTNPGTFPLGSPDAGWLCRSKDHFAYSPASITSYTIGLEDPLVIDSGLTLVLNRVDDTMTFGPTNHPSGTAHLRRGHVLTGGGASANFLNAGNLLWQLEPVGDPGEPERMGFTASSKDHLEPDPCLIIVHAIGIDPKERPTTPTSVPPARPHRPRRRP
jgi:hypothetical protein